MNGMKKIILCITIFLTLHFSVSAQDLNPAKWTFTIEDAGKNEYYLVCTASLEKGWWTYSQFIKDGGPIPTSFHFTENPNIELIGVLSENGTKVKEGIEPMFDMFLKEFGETAIFKQKFKVLHGKTSIEGYVEYMCCDDMQCLPPKEVKFKIGL